MVEIYLEKYSPKMNGAINIRDYEFVLWFHLMFRIKYRDISIGIWNISDELLSQSAFTRSKFIYMF